uniref:Uncharacterized protein n=1 Tax=Oryza glumipatula TaxID=40148 RepID=A0A0E0ANL5_9ORYZ
MAVDGLIAVGSRVMPATLSMGARIWRASTTTTRRRRHGSADLEGVDDGGMAVRIWRASTTTT